MLTNYSVLYQQAGEEYSFQIEFGAKPMPALADVTWIIETPNKTHEVRTSTFIVQYVLTIRFKVHSQLR